MLNPSTLARYALLALLVETIREDLEQSQEIAPGMDRIAEALRLELTPYLVVCDGDGGYLHPPEPGPQYFFETILSEPRFLYARGWDVLTFSFGPRLVLSDTLVFQDFVGVGNDGIVGTRSANRPWEQETPRSPRLGRRRRMKPKRRK